MRCDLTMWTPIFIGLGSNLDIPIDQVKTGLLALENLTECRMLRHSSLYRTPPLGPPGQPDYINAVALLETLLAPLAVLDQLHNIEHQQGRARSAMRWGPRTLDLDLLLYGQRRLSHPRLSLPHPHMHQRGFVLVPMSEIVDRDLYIPGVGPFATLLEWCDTTGIERLKC